MFDFLGMFGNPDDDKPVGQHYVVDEQTYFIVAKVAAFRGTFLAVRVENDKDRQVFRKPVELILHQPTFDAETAKAALVLFSKRRSARQ